ncbi:omptin family outer membrane protease [Neisseriaceae bacterium PsAf]|nr:omptin family outer membrane protease [Neisseriaceae bacterium PsAf]
MAIRCDYKLSRFATIRSLDVHHLRNINWQTRPDKRPIYTSANMTVAYQVSKPLQIFFNTELNYIPKTKLNVTIGCNDKKCLPDKVNRIQEMKHLSKSFSVGMKYQFK